jgi:hypothetical protein
MCVKKLMIVLLCFCTGCETNPLYFCNNVSDKSEKNQLVSESMKLATRIVETDKLKSTQIVFKWELNDELTSEWLHSKDMSKEIMKQRDIYNRYGRFEIRKSEREKAKELFIMKIFGVFITMITPLIFKELRASPPLVNNNDCKELKKQ